VSTMGGSGGAYSVSSGGDLIYYPAVENKMDQSLEWVDRNGATTRLAESTHDVYARPRLSPDGRQAVVRFEGVDDSYLSLLDLDRGAWRRLTFLGDSADAAWSPDGTRIAFTSSRASGHTLLVIPAGGGAESIIYVSPNPVGTPAWSPDGRLAFA